MAHGYKVIVKFSDGSENMVFKYRKEKVADSVVRMYARRACVASVVKEEF